MPKVASQAASHTICQAVSHMDLLIKGRGRKGGGGEEEEEEKPFHTPSLCHYIFPCFPLFKNLSNKKYPPNTRNTPKKLYLEQKDKGILIFPRSPNRAFISKEKFPSYELL